MRQSILFASACLCACATGDEPDDRPPGVGERVIEGSEDYLEDSVGYLKIECGGTPLGYCSSTLIGSETVLTAGHCVFDPEKKVNPDTCRFRFQTPTTASIGVQRVDINPRWKGPYGNDFPNNDLAVLHLEGVAFGAHTEVLTAVGPFPGDTIELVGYGRSEYDDPSTGGVLRSATTTVSKAGNESFSYTVDQGASICNGDSGGPSFQRVHETGERRLVGVHSAGSAMCTESFDTRVGGHLEWILSAAGDDLGCGGVDYNGYCAGSWVVWCDNGSLHTSDCSRDARYSTCGFIDDATGYYCVEPS